MTELPPGRELDALIAEKVIGMYRDELGFVSDHHTATFAPPYSTSIADAWTVIDRLARYHCFTVRNEWDHSVHCEVKWHLEDNRRGECWVQVDSAPHAICLAALKAVNSHS